MQTFSWFSFWQKATFKQCILVKIWKNLSIVHHVPWYYCLLASTTTSIEWQYTGPASSDSIPVLHRVTVYRSCIEWQYTGPASSDSIPVLHRVTVYRSCIEWQYTGPALSDSTGPARTQISILTRGKMFVVTNTRCSS